MGNLLIYNESFENLNEKNINEIFSDFIDSFNTAIHFNDKIFQDKLLKSFNFKFGNFFADLVYCSYEEIILKEPLKKLNQITHQQLYNIFLSIPGGGKEINDREEFLKTSIKKHNGLIGLYEIEHGYEVNLKVFDINSWINWKSNFYTTFSNLAEWTDNDYLPNNKISNYILSSEVNSNSNIIDFKNKNKEAAKEFCDKFNQNGYDRGEAISKAELIGRKIAEVNFYSYQKDLSYKESMRTNSKRTIYKIEKNERDLYLSIDYHKCFCFEVCDHNGKHICEIRFDGLLNGQNTQDKSGRHDIQLN